MRMAQAILIMASQFKPMLGLPKSDTGGIFVPRLNVTLSFGMKHKDLNGFQGWCQGNVRIFIVDSRHGQFPNVSREQIPPIRGYCVVSP